jgi:Acyl-protein synthetase, LuxE
VNSLAAPRAALSASELDAAFLGYVRAWWRGDTGCDEAAFDAHACALFEHQLASNAPYARFAAARGFSQEHLPATWREIPAVPASAFKDALLTTFEPRDAELEFHTSGTTAARAGRHFVERAALYDASLLAGFDRFMLPDRPRLRFLNLIESPRTKAHSSLGYMLGHVSVLRGDGVPSYVVSGETLDVPAFRDAFESARRDGRALCITGTAFAFATLCDALAAAPLAGAALQGSRLMETGGFKGRARELPRVELYARLEAALGIPQSAIVAEYGMTELLSQYYDASETRAAAVRVKVAPPWLRTLVVDASGNELAPGETGFLRHVDLANRSSAVAVETEDRGYAAGAGIVLLGRAAEAEPRGCSLDAEELRARA